MKFLKSREEFEGAYASLKRVLKRPSAFLSNGQPIGMGSMEAMSFSSVLNRDFFAAVTEFCRLVEEHNFALLVVDPDPQEYSDQFSRYNAVRFSTADSPDEYLAAMNDGPLGKSPASITDSSDLMFFYSLRSRWVFACERWSNLALLFFRDEQDRQTFAGCYRGDFFDDLASAEEFSKETGDAFSLSRFRKIHRNQTGASQEPASLSADAAASAIRAIDALNDALNGNLDWEDLAAAVEAAIKSGCATSADLQAVKGRTLDVARMREIIECLRHKAVEGAPTGEPRIL